MAMSGKYKKTFYAGTLQFTDSFAKKNGGGESFVCFCFLFFSRTFLISGEKQKNGFLFQKNIPVHPTGYLKFDRCFLMTLSTIHLTFVAKALGVK